MAGRLARTNAFVRHRRQNQKLHLEKLPMQPNASRRRLDVTVVVPTFNRSGLVGRALDSILNQRRWPNEVIVVDDASTDDTVEKVRVWSELNNFPVKIEVLARNGGAATARNRGIELAKTRYVSFLDSDDEHVPDTLERLVQALDLASDAVLCFGDGEIVTPTNSYPNSLFQPHVNVGLVSEVIGGEDVPIYRLLDPKTTLLKASIIPTSATCFRRDAAIYVGGMPTEFRTGEDWLFWLRLSERGSFVFYLKDLALHYRHAENLTHPKTAEDTVRQKIFAFMSMLNGSFALTLNSGQHKYIQSLVTIQIREWRYQLSRLGFSAYMKGIAGAKNLTGYNFGAHAIGDPKSLVRAAVVSVKSFISARQK